MGDAQPVHEQGGPSGKEAVEGGTEHEGRAMARLINYMAGTGTAHPVHTFVQEIRQTFLGLGFDETENPMFIPESEVHRQYGRDAPIALDHVFYLAGLPRPEVTVGEADREALAGKVPELHADDLCQVLRGYRAGEIDSADLLETITERLMVSEDSARAILDHFPQFRTLSPQLTSSTLRSHMTAGWFPTLQAIVHRARLPIKLFSVGPRFRRELKEDALHLRAHYEASCVIMDAALDHETLNAFLSGLFSHLGFDDVQFAKRRITAGYYRRGTEFEITVKGVKVAHWGLYDGNVLERYGVSAQVMNLEMGVERLLMVRDGYSDIRKLIHPQFYGAWELTDEEIAHAVKLVRRPITPTGELIARKVVEVCETHGSDEAPCEFLVWEGELMGKPLRITVREREAGSKLCGPAFLNEVMVKDGNVFGVLRSERNREVWETAVPTGIRYIDAFASLFAAKLEGSVQKLRGNVKVSAKMIKGMSDINLELEDDALRYILSHNLTIDIRGPMFTTVVVHTRDAEEDVVEL